ncbi:MAG: hypothetical protein ABJG78_06040 [Cyclobacteriaceae bacterium]
MRVVIFGLSQLKMKEAPSSLLCRWLLPNLLILSFSSVFCQNLKCKNIPANQLVFLDSAVIEPGSISSRFSFHYDDESGSIQITSDLDSVKVCYRTLSELLTMEHRNRDISTYDDTDIGEKIEQRNAPLVKEELFDFEGIEKYGAITRGVSFGNRQSVFVNSSLNLQMNGQVADNLYVSAVITDQNIPYQPEGNTQQIRDFDNVFIKLYNDNLSVTAGDILLNNPIQEDYFLRYHKNVQGLQVSYENAMNLWTSTSSISGAVSKGKFASTVIQSIEGLNGPYKLRGPNGERFIIILAGSEKIFLDGKLMQRGFDRDYVIDYNLGEITFNNHVIVTQFSRLRADFEYTEQFYSRSNISVTQAVEKEGVKFYSGFYRERDNPNSSFGFSPNQNDLDQLQLIGDQVDQAFISGVDSIGFDENRILYRKIDTIDFDGISHIIFESSSDPDEELFATTFSDVGFGNGDYQLLQTSSNGRIYQWVSPINGVQQGRYQPGALVPLPNSRQLFNVGAVIDLNTYDQFFSEGAFSDTDRNLFSSLDDTDNSGLAYHGGFRTRGRNSFISAYNWSASISMEYDSKDFSSIDRYRPIEFDRNWDLNVDTLQAVSDLILFAEAELEKDRYNKVSYGVNKRKREQLMQGLQHQARFNQEFNSFRLVSRHSMLHGDQSTTFSKWLESESDLSFRKFDVVPGYKFKIDENELSQQDSIFSSRMHFRSHEFYLASGDSLRSQFRASYVLREDKLPMEGVMEDFLSSKNLMLNFEKSGIRNTWKIDFNYRSTNDRLGLNQGDDEIISGRINWLSNYFKKSLTQNFSFSTGNSRELRREFVYLPVITGEGTHTWRDQNGDGIQDLNEFFEAINPDERTYVKIFTPTDDYITSFQTFYIYTIDARLPRSWRRQGGMKSFLSRFSANVNHNVNYRTTSDSYNNRLNPFSIKLENTSFLSVQDQRRYTMFFNRNGRGFAGDLSLRTSDNKQLLTQGFELKEKQEWISNLKVDLSRDYTFRLTSTFGNFINRSDFLDSRNFEILSDTYEPQLIWQPTKSLRLIGKYKRENKRNELLEISQESSLIQRYVGEFTWNKSGTGSLRSSFSWVTIDFLGDQSTYLAYLLLDALQPGTNQTWQVSWQQKMSKGMQLSLLYNGRKSENGKAIHTGNVQVTAYF